MPGSTPEKEFDMRLKLWVGTSLLVAVVASGAFLLAQPEAQAVDESQAVAVSCQNDISAWDEIRAGSARADRSEMSKALDAAVRCGHQITTEDRELLGEV